MKIVLWIANQENQKALVNRIHQEFPVSAIVTESRKTKRKITFKKIIEKTIEKIFLRSIPYSWYGMLRYYRKKYPGYPDVPLLDVENINSDEVLEFSASFEPDLVIVSGTRLIREKLLSLKTGIGILNLHTGLSPYIKGGPNSTNWCIAEKKFHLIGNTIMWIDEGIDTGNIMATELTSFTGSESLLELHLKVMDHAHDLYIRSIKQVSKGVINNVPQATITKGRTYYNKEWGLKQKWRLKKNFPLFRKEVRSGNLNKRNENIVTIPLR